MKFSWEHAAAGAGSIITALFAWFAGIWLHLEGVNLWILRLGILALGAVCIVGFLVWVRSRKAKNHPSDVAAAAPAQAEAAAPAVPTDDIDLLVREASAKVASSRLGHGATISALPAIFVLGETGSGKTSALLHCGLDPELLAGQIYQEGSVIPTTAANLWFARKTIFVEAAGKLSADAKSWVRLVHRLAPGRLQSIFGRKQQAARAALVCLDCQKFLKPGGADALPSAARALRARLEEMSQQFGVSFPVYFLFCKTDLVPFFDRFVANLTNDEIPNVLGATLALVSVPSSGVYAEQETKRLTAAFNSLFISLSDCRPGLLARERNVEKQPGVYEFPREFRKLGRPVVQFLVDVCRPSHLRAGPFLRGFYFIGRRSVAANPASPDLLAAQSMIRPSTPFSGNATSILRAEEDPARSQWRGGTQIQGAGESQSRQVQQWVFLSHLFSQVLLQDRAALGASGASTKVNFWRRLLFSTAAVIGLVLILGFLTSFIGNRVLESRVLNAARNINVSDGPKADLASAENLRKLDALRVALLTLEDYEQKGPPWRLRWGLYTGTELISDARSVYFNRFYQLMFGQTQDTLRGSLLKVPPAPGASDDYYPVYSNLKAYLMTTAHPEKTTRDFLSPVLMKTWLAGHELEEERKLLAQKQFDFYSDELPKSNPYSSEPDANAVDRGRLYLAQFAVTQRVYHAMLADASKHNPAFKFNAKFPEAATIVPDGQEVEGGFTSAGWSFMQDALQHPEKYFSGEEWVLGQQGGAMVDNTKLQQDLRSLYEKDYIQQWRAFVKAAAVVRYSGIPDAAAKLYNLSGNQSPILVLLCEVSRNTSVDSAVIQKAFQPVQQVTAPGCQDQYKQPSNGNYLTALLQLAGCLDQIKSTPAEQQDAAKGNCVTTATQAKTATLQIAQGFKADPEGHVDRTVQTLMEEPITSAEGLLHPAPLSAGDLCREFNQMAAKYPFNPNSSQEANLAEISLFFRPSDGALSMLYQTKLTGLLVTDGTHYLPKAGSAVNPAFLSFFNQAIRIQQAFYPSAQAAQPQLSFALKALPNEQIESFTVTIDGTTGTSSAPMEFVWPGTGKQGAEMTAKLAGGSELTIQQYDGLWGVFRLFAAAHSQQPAGSGYRLEWMPLTSGQPMIISGRPLVVQFELDTKGAPPILLKGNLSQLSCPARITNR